MPDAVTVHVTVAAPHATVVGWLLNARHMPLWASNFADRVEPDGDDWVAYGPDGAKGVRLAPPNPFGICDHWVTLDDGTVIHMPVRVLPAGTGSLVGMTIIAAPGWDAERLASDAELVRADLDRLRQRIENGPETA